MQQGSSPLSSRVVRRREMNGIFYWQHSWKETRFRSLQLQKRVATLWATYKGSGGFLDVHVVVSILEAGQYLTTQGVE
eukprot:3883366-Amphidinium_carterae.1